MRPLCFVLMPFGKKTDASGMVIDFNRVYARLIQPAIAAAELDPLRADAEMTGGVIHKPMYERLIFCPFAVADLTTANANVFYELGVRHAIRPHTTLLLMSDATRLPFDVAFLRGIPYALAALDDDAAAASVRTEITRRLNEAKDATDSPLFQLVDGWTSPAIDHTKTDVFREQVRYSARRKEELADARARGLDAVKRIDADLGPIDRVEAGVVIDLFLSYRAVKAWPEMVALVDRMPEPLRQTVMVQEQLAFALNRKGESARAERVLTQLITQRGGSSETYGLLGRVYKDRWEAALKDDQRLLARPLLTQAIEAYLRGFETDWRDAYPGVNAVTLMELVEPAPDPRQARLLPVVRYAVERKIASAAPDYWDFATLFELSVLQSDVAGAFESLGQALTRVRETWEPETTARNVRLIRETRQRRGVDVEWIAQLEHELQIAGRRS